MSHRQVILHRLTTTPNVVAVGLLAIVLSWVGLVTAQQHKSASSYGTAAHPFAFSSAFNTPIGAPATNSATAATRLNLAHDLASGPVADLYQFGVPIYTDVTATTPRYHVTCSESWGTCAFAHTLVPIPADATPSPGSDGTLEIINPAKDLLYSFWQAHRSATGWTTSWGTIESLAGPGDTTIEGSGANSGSGISAIAGVITFTDLASRHIDHALAFSSSYTCASYIAPATKTDGATPAPTCIPEGTRIQIDPSINLAAIPGITPLEVMIGQALQTYGAICTNTGGAPIALAFQEPTSAMNPYPTLGAKGDYWTMPHIPWSAIRIVNS